MQDIKLINIILILECRVPLNLQERRRRNKELKKERKRLRMKAIQMYVILTIQESRPAKCLLKVQIAEF